MWCQETSSAVMNLVRLAVAFFVSFLTINRILFAYDAHRRMTKDRENDLTFFKKVCTQIDYRELGRHSVVCVDIEHRLSTSVLFHTARFVVDDTLYKELSLVVMGQLTVAAASIAFLGVLHTRYSQMILREQVSLPTRKTKSE